MNCENCDSTVLAGMAAWHFTCPKCGLESSILSIGDLAQSDAVVDEANRETGLEALRKKGFATTFGVLKSLRTPGVLLDVGCAHGWFLDAGTEAGYECLGIEPSVRVAQLGTARGHTVLTGYFPDALQGRKGFDVVSFNDVFEHIPGARQTMQTAATLLNQGGILSIAIPSNQGVFYRLSKLFARAGIAGPFERMWQKHFSSPHLYYFNEKVLTHMAEAQGLSLAYRGTLPSVRLDGLWARLTYDTKASRWKNVIVYVAVAAAIPILKFLPADIDLLMYKKVAA